MNKFHFVSARPESTTPSALPQNFYNSKASGNQPFSLNKTRPLTKFRVLRTTTALANALAIGLGMGGLVMGVGVAVLTQAQAADNTIAVGGTGTWAETAGGTPATDEADATVAEAVAGENVTFLGGSGESGGILTVTNDGNADDGSGDTNIFSIGNITAESDGKGVVNVQANNDVSTLDGDLTVAIDSMGTAPTNEAGDNGIAVGELNVTGGTGGVASSASSTGATGNSASTTLGTSYVNTVTVTGGIGGTDTNDGTGGAGGASTLTLSGDLEGTIAIIGGTGGAKGADGTGGVGGDAVAYVQDDITGNIAMRWGYDGTGSGGAGAGGAAFLVFNGDATTAAQGSDSTSTYQAVIGDIAGAGTVQNSSTSDYLWLGGNVGSDDQNGAGGSGGYQLTALQLNSGTTTYIAGGLGVLGTVDGGEDPEATGQRLQGGSLELRSNGVADIDGNGSTREGGLNTTARVLDPINVSSLTVRGSTGYEAGSTLDAANGIQGSGDGTGGSYSLRVEDELTVGSGGLSIIGGDGSAASATQDGKNGGTASITVERDVIADITLDDGGDRPDDADNATSGGKGAGATLTIGGSVAQIVTGSISAYHDGEGEVAINNGLATGSTAVTITGAVGASDKTIRLIDQKAGDTIYNSSVDAVSYNQTKGTLQADSTFTATTLNRDANAGTATFTGDATIGALTSDASADATTFAGNANVTTYDHEGGNIDFKGNFTSTTYNHAGGNLTFSGTSGQTITAIGDEDDTDGGFTLDEGSILVSNPSTAGVTFANAVTLKNGLLIVEASANATFFDTVTLTTTDTVVADGATATFGDNITMTAGKLEVGDGGTAVINSALTMTSGTASTIGEGSSGTLQINDTLTLGSADSDLIFADGSTVALGITTGTAITTETGANAGSVTVASSDAKVTVVAANGMKAEDEVIIVDDAAGSTLADTSFEENVASKTLVNFTLSETSAGNFIISAASKSLDTIASELGLSISEAEQLLAAFNSSTSSAFADFVGGATPEEAALVADQTAVQEETLSASIGAISGAANQVADITVDRLASLRTGDAYGLEAEQAASGFATGDGAMTRNVWGKFFYNVADQDNADDAAGYDSDTTGFAFGSDAEVGANMRVGASLAMSQSDVDGNGAGDSQTDIDSYQLTVYGDLTQSDYFIDWQVGASTSSVETLTVVDPNSGVSGSNADYNSMTYLAKVGVGMPLNISAGDMGEGARFTPYGSLGFQRITSDSYDLIFPDDPGLNQNVSPDEVDELTGSLGGRYTVAIETEGGATLSPQVRGSLNYDFIGNTAEATSTYNDGTELTVKGVEAEKFGASLGAGINYVSDATTLGFDIDSTLKDGYASYTGALNFRLQF